MEVSPATCVLDAKALIGESPCWDARSGVLYWVDIPARKIHRYDPVSGSDKAWLMSEEVGCVANCADNTLVIALRKGFFRFDPVRETLSPLFKTDAEPVTNRFNDGKTDRQGRFWCGSTDEAEKAPTGALYCLDRGLHCRRLVDGIICSNALCWSPDGRIMYFGDSSRQTVWAWNFEPGSGAIFNRRVFVSVPVEEGAPDGATVDSEGYIWIAQWGGWRVVRYDPKGRIDRVLRLPVSQPACPAFGGPDLNTLYIATAAIGLSAEAHAREPLAGGLFAVNIGVSGIAEVPFRYEDHR